MNEYGTILKRQLMRNNGNTWRTTRPNYENNHQDALYRLIYYSKSALHVSGDVFAHHQEHLTVFTVSDSMNVNLDFAQALRYVHSVITYLEDCT
jgi:hypothetical protein